MHVILTVVGGKADRRQVRVKVPVTIGRSRQAGLVVTHPMVSRRHCELYIVNGMLRVRDLGSLNGVFVGGKRVVDAPLPPQTEFSIGPLTLRVDYSLEQLRQEAQAPDSPPPLDQVAVEELADFELEFDEPNTPQKADVPGIFPTIAPESPLSPPPSGVIPAEVGPPAEFSGQSPEESSPQQGSPADLPTLFPEDLPPDLR
jgi:predicted component of type VI protein secretion system